jgi:hypothetical protein
MPNISVGIDLYSSFDQNSGTIKISTAPMPYTDLFFRQFLYEYSGFNFNLRADTLRFLHEVGHAMTISNFDDIELFLLQLLHNCDEDLEGYEAASAYWESPEEFAANMWLINFVFEHFENVFELNKIFEERKIYAA